MAQSDSKPRNLDAEIMPNLERELSKPIPKFLRAEPGTIVDLEGHPTDTRLIIHPGPGQVIDGGVVRQSRPDDYAPSRLRQALPPSTPAPIDPLSEAAAAIFSHASVAGAKKLRDEMNASAHADTVEAQAHEERIRRWGEFIVEEAEREARMTAEKHARHRAIRAAVAKVLDDNQIPLEGDSQNND